MSKALAEIAGLVSCLCVTRQRPHLLQRAVECFRVQTYAQKELVIVYEADDAATRDYVLSLPLAAIRPLEVSVRQPLTLGSLRNASVAFARGEYVAQWDDDDWYAPTRLAEQVDAVQQNHRAGCVLARWIMYDELDSRAYVSARRLWEGSLVCARSEMPLYPDLSRGEDTVLISQLWERDKLVALDRPELYIYAVHQGNTWGRAHWETNLKPFAHLLDESTQHEVRSIMKRLTRV